VIPTSTPSSCRPQWNEVDRATLAASYGTGGIRAARAAFPLIPQKAIYNAAIRFGIRSPRQRPRAVSKYPSDPQLDALIQRYYITAEDRPIKGRMAKFARSINRPAWWVRKRAAYLGLAIPSDKEPQWSAAETELLEQHAHKAVPRIQKIFLTNGFRRTEAAIGLRLRRGDFDRLSTEEWSGNALARLLGVDGKTVTRWIAAEGLKATRRGTHRTDSQGGDIWVISRANLRRWISSHQQLVDLRKVDRFWFLDLAFGACKP